MKSLCNGVKKGKKAQWHFEDEMGIQTVPCKKGFSLEGGAGFMNHGSAAREAGSRRIAQGCNHRRSDQGLESNFVCPSTTKRRLDTDPAPRSTNSGHADGLTTIHTHLATDIGRRSWTSELSPPPSATVQAAVPLSAARHFSAGIPFRTP